MLYMTVVSEGGVAVYVSASIHVSQEAVRWVFSINYVVKMKTDKERETVECSLHILDVFSLHLAVLSYYPLLSLLVTQVLSSNSGVFLSPLFCSLCDKVCL